MRSNTQFPIAVHALLLIAKYGHEVKVTSGIIAQSTGTNAVVIRRIFGKLKRAGLLSVSAGRGATGLGRPAESISLWDVYDAVEAGTSEAIFRIHPNISPMCPLGRYFYTVLSGHLDEAVAAMREQLSGVTLGTLLSEINEHSAPRKNHRR